MSESWILIVLGLAFLAWGILGNSFTYGDIFGYSFLRSPAPRWLGKLTQILFGVAGIAFGIYRLIVHH